MPHRAVTFLTDFRSSTLPPQPAGDGTMFHSLPRVPPDPIFSLFDEFRADPRPGKIDLTLGVWQDDEGRTPVLQCVKAAERQILDEERSKNYLGIAGLGKFNRATARLLLGDSSPAISAGRYMTIQTPGGTGALRIVAEYLDKMRSQTSLWIGAPTWANHHNIFSQANVRIRQYNYLQKSKTGLDFESLVNALSESTEGDAFLFHACCHNPSGFDLAVDEWEIVFGFVRERNLLAIFDCAYQGFDRSIDEDVWPLRRLAELETEFLVCSSNSKNFGLYGERVGALTGVCNSVADAERLDDYLQSLIRAVYSNPPKHGAAIVATVLDDADLRSQWLEELAAMRERIAEMRRLLMKELALACGGTERDRLGTDGPAADGTGRFDFLARQAGMFGFTGLTPEQVDRLRAAYSIYMLRSGRINVSGVRRDNVGRLCQSIAEVMNHPAPASP